MTLDLHSTKQLNDGRQMPRLGLGVWQSTGGDEIVAVEHALKSGYRHIDTAAIYKNEEGVAEGIRRSGVARKDIWITTKLWNDDIRAGKARDGFMASLERLKVDYVDLYLLHWPVPGIDQAWSVLEALQGEGLAKSIGVSNFQSNHLDGLIKGSKVTPAVNQIEWHPYLQQAELAAQCATLGIALEAWSPLVQGKFKDDPLFTEIGRAHGKSAAQVLIRWHLQRDVIVIPKSVTPSRIEENADVFDFELTEVEMKRIDQLERDGRVGPHPSHITF